MPNGGRTMAKPCPHCGETSDRDNICTWCNKPLTAPKPADQPPPQGAARKPATTPAAGSPVVHREVAPVEQPRPLWPYYLGALATFLVLSFGGAFVTARLAAGAPPEPADWKSVETMTKVLTLQVPGNWTFSTSGSQSTYEQASIKATRLCRVYIDGNATKGAMGDVAAAAARVGGGSAELRFHASQGELHKKRDPKYEESGEAKPCTFGGVPAAYSEYTTLKKVAGFGVKLRGWRISTSNGDYGYQVWVEAPDKQFDKFEPMATKLLGGVKFASQQ